MNQVRWLIKASQLARRPPSRRRIILYLVVLAASLGIAGIEWLGLWPDWLTVDRGRLNP